MEHGKGGREGVGLVEMGKGRSSSMRKRRRRRRRRIGNREGGEQVPYTDNDLCSITEVVWYA
jgi:hypothetical protein